jgi:hypothetical protein
MKGPALTWQITMPSNSIWMHLLEPQPPSLWRRWRPIALVELKVNFLSIIIDRRWFWISRSFKILYYPWPKANCHSSFQRFHQVGHRKWNFWLWAFERLDNDFHEAI